MSTYKSPATVNLILEDISKNGPIAQTIEGLVVKVLARQHEWQGLSSSGSCHWKCAKCGLYASGGVHDGGPYCPGRGQIIPDCKGRING